MHTIQKNGMEVCMQENYFKQKMLVRNTFKDKFRGASSDYDEKCLPQSEASNRTGFASQQQKVPFSMAIENKELAHKC